MEKIVYFSKMFQAVPHLAQIARQLPGTFVSNRRVTLEAVAHHYPQLPQCRWRPKFGPLSVGARALSRADVIVTGSAYEEVLAHRNSLHCMVFHGTYMFLSRSAVEANLGFDLLCLIGPRMVQMLDRHRDRYDLPDAVVTGFLPFGEFPDYSATEKHALLHRLQLDPTQPTVVYTPSRRGHGSWESFALPLLDSIPPGYNLVLRPHPSHAITPNRSDKLYFDTIRKRCCERPNTLLDLAEFPLSTMLALADLVVSDGNSPAEESLFYDTPQLLIESTHLSQQVLQQQGEMQGMHPDDMAQLLTLYDCGPGFHTAAGAPPANLIERALADADHYRAARQRYFDWVFGSRDRLANERVAAALQQKLAGRH